MPETITVAASLRVGSGLMYGQFTKTAVQSGTENVATTQNIAAGTGNGVLVDVGAVNSSGDIYIENTDVTNYVEIANVEAMTGWPQKILAGKSILLHPTVNNPPVLYARANTTAVNIRVVAVEL